MEHLRGYHSNGIHKHDKQVGNMISTNKKFPSKFHVRDQPFPKGESMHTFPTSIDLIVLQVYPPQF